MMIKSKFSFANLEISQKEPFGYRRWLRNLYLLDIFADHQLKLPCQQIVLEISEEEDIENMKAFRLIVHRLKNYCFLIAIDDFGKGYSKKQLVIELEPNFIKFDWYFSTDLSISPKKQRFINFNFEYCKGDMETILEGIEEPQDLATAKLLVVSIAKGFLLGKPDLLSEMKAPLNSFKYQLK
jgi:EAL domain-containing protein (putative c-di-GMP-specific phosphodiesterase class I)